MRDMRIRLKKEMQQLGKVVEQTRNRLQDVPKGHLKIMKKRGKAEYYYKSPDTSSKNGRYLKKSEINLAREIAQRDYDVQVVKNAEEQLSIIDTFLKKYNRSCLGEIYEKMNPHRRELLSTVILSDEEYIKQWQAVPYVGKGFEKDAPEIITEKGERVRSKSEKIIADKLYALGIPYRYEYPILLEGNVRMHPDFTILRMPEKEEVYLEHFGLMDDSGYVDNVLFRLRTYERNRIFVGDKLFFTYETGKEPLNTRVLDKFLRKLFCEEE